MKGEDGREEEGERKGRMKREREGHGRGEERGG